MTKEYTNLAIIEDLDALIGFYYPQTDIPLFNESNLEKWLDTFLQKMLPENVLGEAAVGYKITGEPHWIPKYPFNSYYGISTGFFSISLIKLPSGYTVRDFVKLRGAELNEANIKI